MNEEVKGWTYSSNQKEATTETTNTKEDENKGKNSIPRMGWFHASGIAEIINVCWPFIMWISKKGQVDWWIKIQKLYVFKEKYNKQVLC